MAKVLDYNGLLYFYGKLKAKFSVIGHTHGLSTTTKSAVKTWSANTPTAVTLPTLTTSSISIPNISSNTVVTGGTTTNITPVTSNTVVTSVTNNVPTSASVSDNVFKISPGTACSSVTGDSVTAGTAVAAYTTLTTGDSITVGTATTATGVGTWTDGSVTAGTAASLTTENVTVLTSSTTDASVS